MLLQSVRVVGDFRPANYTYLSKENIIRYLLIVFFRKPNGQIDEQVSISKRLRPADIQTCNVIMDFGKKKVEKCVVEGKTVDTDWNKLNEYYKRIYPALVYQLEKNNTESEVKKK